MKISRRKFTSRHAFRLIMVMMLLATLGFGIYTYFSYKDLMLGNIELNDTPAVLTRLDIGRFDDAVSRLERRRQLPSVDPGLRNPFLAK